MTYQKNDLYVDHRNNTHLHLGCLGPYHVTYDGSYMNTFHVVSDAHKMSMWKKTTSKPSWVTNFHARAVQSVVPMKAGEVYKTSHHTAIVVAISNYYLCMYNGLFLETFDARVNLSVLKSYKRIPADDIWTHSSKELIAFMDRWGIHKEETESVFG